MKSIIMKYTHVVVGVCIYLFMSSEAWGNVKLPAIFGNNMVLQRDMSISIWGWADPGEKVSVMLAGRAASVKTGRQGTWVVALPSIKAGGPYDLIIKGKNAVTFTGVLVGDVWLCGGQSNMQWNVSQTDYKETDTSFVNSAAIRLYTVQTKMDYMPGSDVKSTGWKKLSMENINTFSAVGYHFGKYLAAQLEVPVGLISNNLGATAVETWMSNEALLAFPQFRPVVEPIVKAGKNFSTLEAAFEKMKPEWYTKYYYKGIGVDGQWYKPETDITDWTSIKASGNLWEDEPALMNHDGEVWFRTTFDLPDNIGEKEYPIYLGQIDDYDMVWVNGEKVGETYGKHNHRNYTVPARLLKAKGNVLVVRVFDVGGIGGFTTSPFWGNPILWGNWVYKKGEAIDASRFPQPDLPNATPFSSPGVLYNGNIAPLTKFAIKGVIWYQGESNVDRAYEYRDLFPAMIKDWRNQWKQGDFPFLFVQLANHEDESAMPGPSNWAELREAQAMALTLPNTGMATAIDVGEAKDIHPKNKMAVGMRLGITAMKVAYGKTLVSSGPAFSSIRVEGSEVIVQYGDTGGGLITKDKYGYVNGFQIAGADQKFYWAQAKIKGTMVIVTSEQVATPVAVRYAWDNNPGLLNLYNKEGFPAIPFRSDAWKGITAEAVFRDGARF